MKRIFLIFLALIVVLENYAGFLAGLQKVGPNLCWYSVKSAYSNTQEFEEEENLNYCWYVKKGAGVIELYTKYSPSEPQYTGELTRLKMYGAEFYRNEEWEYAMMLFPNGNVIIIDDFNWSNPNETLYDKKVQVFASEEYVRILKSGVSGGGMLGGGFMPNIGGSSSGGSGSSGGSTYRTCPSCGGSGTCPSCHGSGGEWRDTGYYTGSGSRSWISCPSCSGSKRCFNCHGSGRI